MTKIQEKDMTDEQKKQVKIAKQKAKDLLWKLFFAIFIWPFALIFSLNTLFHLDIQNSWDTYISAVVLMVITGIYKEYMK